MVQKERRASSEGAGSLKERKEAGVDSGAGGDEVEVEVEVEEAGALSLVGGPGRRASDMARVGVASASLPFRGLSVTTPSISKLVTARDALNVFLAHSGSRLLAETNFHPSS